MPRLPGTEEWDEDIVQGKARYYLDTMASVAEMARLFAPRGRQAAEDETGDLRFHDEVVDVRLEQFTEAIGLLLATDHTEEAVSLFANPTWVLKGKPLSGNPNGFGIVNVNIRQIIGLSLFAALAKEGRLSLGDGGLEYVTAFGTLALIRDLDSEREFFAVLPTLFAIAVASNSTPFAIYDLARNLALMSEQYGNFGYAERPEAQLLGIYRTFLQNDFVEVPIALRFTALDGFVALREFERRYAARIREMRNDRYHWVRMNAPGDLIDWVLLVTQVVMLRRESSPFLPENFAITPEVDFCWNLARALA